MNSVVQCLSHTSELTKYLRNQSSGTRSSSSERKDQRIFNGIYLLFFVSDIITSSMTYIFFRRIC
jgi:hypothetical protein